MIEPTALIAVIDGHLKGDIIENIGIVDSESKCKAKPFRTKTCLTVLERDCFWYRIRYDNHPLSRKAFESSVFGHRAMRIVALLLFLFIALVKSKRRENTNWFGEEARI